MRNLCFCGFQIHITLLLSIIIKMVHNTQNPTPVTVEFFVDSLTHFGSNVYICGNSQQLGHWTPQEGIKLETNKKNYPQWKSGLIFLRPNTFIEFKACIIRDSMVWWENISHNRVIFTGSQSIQVFFHFDGPYTQVCEKKIVQIECRNGIDSIMNDMESDWGSSIGHPSNYPLEKYHKFQRGDRKFNRSQVSSNLMSTTESDQIELEMKILNYFNPRTLTKTMSRPSEFECYKHIKKINDISLHLNIISQGCESATQSPKGRSYRSLPKYYSRSSQKAIFRQRVQATKSFPNLFLTLLSKQKSRKQNQNRGRENSERKVRSEDETMKASVMSVESGEMGENGDLNEEVQDLFGLEIF